MMKIGELRLNDTFRTYLLDNKLGPVFVLTQKETEKDLSRAKLLTGHMNYPIPLPREINVKLLLRKKENN